MMAARQRGVALGIVLWFLAGMSLLVSGIVHQARTDTRATQLHLSRASVIAASDGAMQLMLAQLVSVERGTSSAGVPLSGKFAVGPHEVDVYLVPAEDLININKATVPTLTKLMASRGGLDAGEAQTIADNVVKWRRGSGSKGGKKNETSFQSLEDLLQVDGVSRTLWDAIRDAIVVNFGGSAEGGGVTADTDSGGPDSSRQQPADGASGRGGAQSKLGNSFRVDALVRYGERTWLRRKWAYLGANDKDSLPWSYARIEAPRVLPDAANKTE